MMKSADVRKLPLGLYRLYWHSGGSSLACVGALSNGDRWFACANWTSDAPAGIASSAWCLVGEAIRIDGGEE